MEAPRRLASEALLSGPNSCGHRCFWAGQSPFPVAVQRELSASVREAEAGVGVDWRSILHSKWRTTDAKWNEWSGRRPGRIPTQLWLLAAEAASERNGRS